jgi:sugar lactone lactonase YvrE
MQRPLKFLAAAGAALVASTTFLATGSTNAQSPATIDFPDDDFDAEGVAVGAHDTFYAGSRTNGRIAFGDISAGASAVFVDDPLVPAATGLKADLRHGLLWVAGAGTGMAAVYDLQSGEGVVALTLTTEPSFINDVVVTRDAAYFTNSLSPEIYRVPVSRDGDVGTPQTIHLSGPAAGFVMGFNLNGIDATQDGRTLFAVNSAAGTLYTIDAATGGSAQIALDGGDVTTGDGILLVGRTLLVLQNGTQGQPNQIAVVRLRHGLTTGEIVGTVTNPNFENATTLARSGGTLLAVNAQFVPPAPIDAEPEVVVLDLADAMSA